MNEILHEQIKVVMDQIKEGWCSVEKAIAMADLIVEHKPRLCVEIGVFAGRSIVPQAMALNYLGNGGIVYGIDPWNRFEGAAGDDDEKNKSWWESIDINGIHNYAVDQIWGRDLQNRCVLIRAPSYACYGLFDNIDILHIDGNHADPSAQRDVRLYVPRVKPGGFVWFDDANWHQTQNAVNMMGNYCDLVKSVESCNLYQRREFKSRSQAGQDVFAYEVLRRSNVRNGTFLDIGANHPEQHNNTFALEQMGWSGWLVDNDPALVELNATRRSPFTLVDSTKADWLNIIPSDVQVIDYLSLDVDFATLDTLRWLPLDRIKFRVITIEHDSYRFGVDIRNKMREILSAAGYCRICTDVCVAVGGKKKKVPFEDWWVHPELVNMGEAVRFKAHNKPWNLITNACQVPSGNS